MWIDRREFSLSRWGTRLGSLLGGGSLGLQRLCPLREFSLEVDHLLLAAEIDHTVGEHYLARRLRLLTLGRSSCGFDIKSLLYGNLNLVLGRLLLNAAATGHLGVDGGLEHHFFGAAYHHEVHFLPIRVRKLDRDLTLRYLLRLVFGLDYFKGADALLEELGVRAWLDSLRPGSLELNFGTVGIDRRRFFALLNLVVVILLLFLSGFRCALLEVEQGAPGVGTGEEPSSSRWSPAKKATSSRRLAPE